MLSLIFGLMVVGCPTVEKEEEVEDTRVVEEKYWGIFIQHSLDNITGQYYHYLDIKEKSAQYCRYDKDGIMHGGGEITEVGPPYRVWTVGNRLYRKDGKEEKLYGTFQSIYQLNTPSGNIFWKN